MTLEDIQKGRFDCGAIVYDTNNKRFAVVLDGKRGNDKEPCSYAVTRWRKGFVTHTPPNPGAYTNWKIHCYGGISENHGGEIGGAQ